MSIQLVLISIFYLLVSTPAAVLAEEEARYTVTIKEHRFVPEALHVPADQKFKLIVDNQDDTPEEFESTELGREKLIKAGKKGTILLGPLKQGQYHFQGEFHENSAKGMIISQS